MHDFESLLFSPQNRHQFFSRFDFLLWIYFFRLLFIFQLHNRQKYIFFLYKNLFAFDLFLGFIWGLRNHFWEVSEFCCFFWFFLSQIPLARGVRGLKLQFYRYITSEWPLCTWYVSVSRGFLLFGWSLITSHLLDCMHAYTYDIHVHMHASLSLNWKFFFILPLNCLLFSVRFVEADFGN